MNAEENERALEKQAVAELLKEASRGKEREKTLGTEGWRKKVARPNKLFIGRSLAGALRQSKYQEKTRKKKDCKNPGCNRKAEASSHCSIKKSNIVCDVTLREKSSSSGKHKNYSAERQDDHPRKKKCK